MKGNAIIDGLVLMQPYAKDEWFIHAEHDVLYGLGVDEVPEDVAEKLRALGWHQEFDCWAVFT